MSEPTRYKLDPESYLAEHPDGDFVDYQDYASLKAFSDEAQAHIAKEERKSRERLDMEQAENARLKAEVERLTKAVMHSPAAQLKLKELEGKTTFEEINPKDDNSNINTELLALSNRQASDIRRLTKAGDAMAEEIALAKRQDEGSRFDPIEMHYDHELIVKWNAAKEGK